MLSRKPCQHWCGAVLPKGIAAGSICRLSRFTRWALFDFARRSWTETSNTYFPAGKVLRDISAAVWQSRRILARSRDLTGLICHYYLVAAEHLRLHGHVWLNRPGFPLGGVVDKHHVLQMRRSGDAPVNRRTLSHASGVRLIAFLLFVLSSSNRSPRIRLLRAMRFVARSGISTHWIALPTLPLFTSLAATRT